jgi:hypothetical protein
MLRVLDTQRIDCSPWTFVVYTQGRRSRPCVIWTMMVANQAVWLRPSGLVPRAGSLAESETLRTKSDLRLWMG